MQSSSDNGSRFPQTRAFKIVIWVAILAVIGLFVLFWQSSHKPSFPKADQEQSTTFQGLSSFISGGLTTDQVNDLIKAFSKFSPTARKIVIDQTSLNPEPHDPNKDTSFKTDFSLKIDSTSYKGVVSYSDLESIQLTLLNTAGKQVFDSGVITAGN